MGGGDGAIDWAGFIAATNGELAALRKAAPEATAGFSALAKGAMAAGALDPKAKELIALGIGVAKQCDACIAYHVKALVGLGATREEIAETVGVCVYMGGGPSLMYGAKALAAYDALVG
ncbi:carboxymuconolactone decarboxylase family protein [Rubrimonas cliftonensis]|uniref:Alkylhydroperoxidase AhpD family core domain-containing protein n=1 Tax=Rubrimonas cliftonensis TaxID=89524 RepID=A0A1H3YPH6_9RHOB|nr:carboxymuconolactone decarboxylase family protein [Rubrimonas cliftonensis]SEA13420.1 alkylhydroperoxidase AhpD family core domain-containing protein [Rubrimonas cliftonensis]